MPHIDYAASYELAHATDPVAGYCWENAARVVLDYQHQAPGAQYVEGYAWCELAGFLVPHGWVQLANGDIADPTLPLQRGWAHSITVYTLGAVYRRPALVDLQANHGELRFPITARMAGPRARNGPAYVEARALALWRVLYATYGLEDGDPWPEDQPLYACLRQ